MRRTTELVTGLKLLGRSSLITTFIFSIFTLSLIALAASQFSGRQPATVALDMGISFIRFILPVAAALFAQELFSREFDRKFYLLSITYPTSRIAFLLWRFSAIALATILILSTLAVILGLITAWASTGYEQSTPPGLGAPYILTIALIFVDSLAAISLAIFFSIIAKTPSFVLIGTMGTVMICRTFTPIINLLQGNSALISNSSQYSASLSSLRFFLPDLSILDVRTITLYNQISFLPEKWHVHALSVLLYTIALLAYSAFIFEKKNLG